MSGHYHPLSLFTDASLAFFQKYGFEVVDGPERETEWYNFDFLRIPRDHPARDLQATFWLPDGRLLRTHTTALQGRVMRERRPPFRIVTVGRVFRNEATDATHEAVFYQLDGFAVEEGFSMAHLKGLLHDYLTSLFGQRTKLRFVPHHYPFVEPGMDAHIRFGRQWLEVLGSGMIHPEVLSRSGIDPRRFRGIAFGLGIDRLVMALTGIRDIRLLYQNDFRLLGQF